MNTILYQLLLGVLAFTGIYDININTIDGNIQSLLAMKDKKIMIVILPTGQDTRDSLFLEGLDSIAVANRGVLTIVGIPSYEDGFSVRERTALKSWWRQVMGESVFLADGMYTRKTSRVQHPLLAWLTHYKQNGHFDDDCAGARDKYFVDKQGQLYGVVGPQVPLTSQIIQNLLR